MTRRLVVGMLAFFCSATAHTQLDTATIIDTVSDSMGAVVSGAKLEVHNLGTGSIAQLTSDASGSFNAPVFSVGMLEFRAEFAPIGSIRPPFFGQSRATITTAGGFASNRQVQFGLKYLF
jgi:hypothetical protein